jgi:hypothetical protein
VDYGLLKRGRKIKSRGRKARVSSDVDSRRGDGHRVDVDLAGRTKPFYALIFGKFLL